MNTNTNDTTARRLSAARAEAERLGYTCKDEPRHAGGALLTMRKDVRGWRGGPVTGFAEATVIVGGARCVLSSCTLAHGCPGDVARVIYAGSDDAMAPAPMLGRGHGNNGDTEG